MAKKFSSKFTVGIELIDPDLAREYLSKAPENQRNINVRNYESIYSAMRDGFWEASGDPIRFNEDDQLIDGQHRLQALVASGKTYEFVVQRGLARTAFSVIDTGAKRTPADLLRIAGYQNTTNVASTIRILVGLELVIGGACSHTSLGKGSVSPDIILAYAERNSDELYNSTKIVTGSKVAKQVCSPPSVFTALHFMFSKHDAKSADEFFKRLITGDQFEYGSSDPVYQLRNLLIEDRISKHQRQRPTFYKAAVTIKAWNAFQERRKIISLRFSENESWPEICNRATRVRKDVAERRDSSTKKTSKKQSRKRN